MLTGRELFPGSDCLKWSERKSLLLAEMGDHALADVVCLQVSSFVPFVYPLSHRPVQQSLYRIVHVLVTDLPHRRNVIASPMSSPPSLITNISRLEVQVSDTVWSYFTEHKLACQSDEDSLSG